MGSGDFIFHGNLADTTLPMMLATIHRHAVPGLMEFRSNGETKRIYFIDGDVIFATSSNRGESLGDFLLQQGRISEAQYRVSVDELKRSQGRRHGSILVQMGFISPQQLGTAVRDQVQTIVWSIFNWDDGDVTFKVGRFREEEVYKTKIPTPRAVLSGCKHITEARKVTARLGSRRTVFTRRPWPPHLSELRLEAGEQQLLEMVDGNRTLLELCEKGPLSPGLNARVLYALTELAVVESGPPPASGIRIQVRQDDA